jgi:hypothetical protein
LQAEEKDEDAESAEEEDEDEEEEVGEPIPPKKRSKMNEKPAKKRLSKA